MTMYEMTMAGFLRLANSQWGKEAQWMAIKVTLPDAPDTEILINPKKNFEAKFKYISEKYNEELVHKQVPTIKIVGYAFALTFEDLQRELGIEE